MEEKSAVVWLEYRTAVGQEPGGLLPALAL
jgi:hypothetical protein